MNLLFVCSRARRRSATAEAVFAGVAGCAAMAAGTAPDADEPVTADHLDWADVVFVMQEVHRARLNRTLSSALRGKRVVCLGIPDDYDFMDTALVRLLWDRVPQSVPALAAAPQRPGGSTKRGGP